MIFKGIAASLALFVVSAEKTIITDSGRKAIVPRVGEDECQEWCIFKWQVE